jgi:hypothetical protein
MLSSLVVLGGLVALPMVAAQFTVDPPTTAPDDTIRDCTNWWVALDGDTCELIAESNFISLEQLYAYVCCLSLLSDTFSRLEEQLY